MKRNNWYETAAMKYTTWGKDQEKQENKADKLPLTHQTDFEINDYDEDENYE